MSSIILYGRRGKAPVPEDEALTLARNEKRRLLREQALGTKPQRKVKMPTFKLPGGDT